MGEENNGLMLCSWCRCSIVDEPIYLAMYPDRPLCSEVCVDAVLESVRNNPSPAEEYIQVEVDDESLPY